MLRLVALASAASVASGFGIGLDAPLGPVAGGELELFTTVELNFITEGIEYDSTSGTVRLRLDAAVGTTATGAAETRALPSKSRPRIDTRLRTGWR
jgi:hypothetical protein